MDFKGGFGKFVKSLGDNASSAAKKSSELFEVTKLNMSIQSQEDEICELEEEIGSCIYKSYKEGFKSSYKTDEKVRKLCKRIDEIKSNITSMNKKIGKIKNIRVCSKCGEELPSDTKYCPYCGKVLS